MRDPIAFRGSAVERDAVGRVAALLANGFTRRRALNEHVDGGATGSLHPNRGSSHLELSDTADLHPALAVDASQKREVR